MAKLKTRPEKWFELPDDPDGARVKIKHITSAESSRVAGRFVAYEKNDVGERMAVNIVAGNRATAAAAIIAWEKFSDETGNEMPCTPANKELWLDEEGFLEWINEKRQELADEAEKKSGDLAKNSKGGRRG